jgi:sigma-B regulation protein RsbU (phosphoserine phosphatase)
VEARACALGANDYLVKLSGPIAPAARVRYHSRAYLSRPERDQAHRQLAEEVVRAARYVRSLLPERPQGGVGVGWASCPRPGWAATCSATAGWGPTTWPSTCPA